MACGRQKLCESTFACNASQTHKADLFNISYPPREYNVQYDDKEQYAEERIVESIRYIIQGRKPPRKEWSVGKGFISAAIIRMKRTFLGAALWLCGRASTFVKVTPL